MLRQLNVFDLYLVTGVKEMKIGTIDSVMNLQKTTF